MTDTIDCGLALGGSGLLFLGIGRVSGGAGASCLTSIGFGLLLSPGEVRGRPSAVGSGAVKETCRGVLAAG